MATKHFFSSQDGLVATALRGVVSQNPKLKVIESDKIVFDGTHDRKKVSLISGGGSGHEPAHAGYVGEGMLSAAVCGDVFASPSTKQIEVGCQAVHSDEGYIFIVTNYTGDMLHFGLAAEKINAAGGRAGLIKSADDVSVGRAHGGLVGRRGLSGTIVINKVLGAAAAAKNGFDAILSLGHALSDNLVTINAGLDHCHVPGRGEDYGQLGRNQCEIGLGIHNEPGVQMLDKIPSADDLVKSMLTLLLDQTDKDRAFVKFDSQKDKVAMLINNLGGVSILEQNALVDVVRRKLEEEYGVVPIRVYSGHFMTSLNAPVFAVTLLNISNTARVAKLSDTDIISYLDAPTSANNWPAPHYFNNEATPIDLASQTHQVSHESHVSNKGHAREWDLEVDPETLRDRLNKVANNIIAKEPDLTEWDTKMGDGDCGKTYEAGARALLQSIESDGLTKRGSVLDVLEKVLDITEDKMGGTLGAIFGIYFAAFVSSLKALLSEEERKGAPPSEYLSVAAEEALRNLRKHTPAAEGDRTVMDVLIPFVKSFATTQSIETAARTAETAAEHTRKIKPKLGRATYVGGIDDMSEFPPDPGAYGVYEIVKGLNDSS